MRIAYLVHNLADPAVAKRVRMLRAFDDEVVLFGFHRDDTVIKQVADIDAIDLGETRDGGFVQRIAMVAKRCLSLSTWAKSLHDCDVIVARNLEMLALAAWVRRFYAPGARLVYECLDIHRLMLSRRWAGAMLRRLEGFLLDHVSLVIVSSPAFLREYFEPSQALGGRRKLPTLLVENKLLPASFGQTTASYAASRSSTSSGPSGARWRIGWYGMIRCCKSLDYLCDLAKRHPGLVEVVIRGRPSYIEFADFDAQIAQSPGISFGGAYRSDDLAILYGDVHFSWAIDCFEEGANSRWLLPNRIYEGGAYNAVPIALDDTETARWLRQRNFGVCLPSIAAFEQFLLALTPARYAALKQASGAVPKSDFIADDRDCARLLDVLGGNVVGAKPGAGDDSANTGSVKLEIR